MLSPFLLDRYKPLFSGRSSPRIPEIIDRGQILYVNMPVAEQEAMARIVATFVKLEYFRSVLRGRTKSRRTLFFWGIFELPKVKKKMMEDALSVVYKEILSKSAKK